MLLRRFVTFNENGQDSEEELQYWDTDHQRWISVRLIRVPLRQASFALTDPTLC